jgi:hypothetical protein
MATYPNVNAANQYARDIVGGKILACQLTVLACQRHLDDLERAKDPNWPYRFDKNKAERFLRFAQKMPHTSGEWARRNSELNLNPGKSLPWRTVWMGEQKAACVVSLKSISSCRERTGNPLLPLL